MKLFDLTGKTAIVTGSTRGIGRAIATAIAEAGGRVVISGRKQPACETAAAEINAAVGGEHTIGIAAHISEKAALQAMVDETRSRLGPIDILVCNAASSPHYGPMLGISDAEFHKVLENNVVSSNWLIQMVAPDMIERQGGAIIIVSSIGGLIGSDVIGAYSISKAADFQLVRNLAVELGPYNIRVNAIAPGTIRTEFARMLYEDPKAEAHLNRATPLGRIGEPADIAGAAVFLASQAGVYMTGQSMVIDGGFTIGRTSA